MDRNLHSATTSLFLEPVAHPIERFDHVERIYGLLEFPSQSLDVTVDCTIIYINLIIVGGIHQGVAAFDHAGTPREGTQPALPGKAARARRSKRGSAIARSRARRSIRPWRRTGSRISGESDTSR